MNQYLSDALEEIKRVDHLVFVSLKYTRTVDVIRSVIDRTINALEFIFLAFLDDLKEKKIIEDIPSAHGVRVNILEQNFSDDIEIKEFLEFYTFLRKIIRAEYAKREEYRRHVTMITNLDDGNTVEINIDILNDYYDRIKKFLHYAVNLLAGEKNE
ncbi:MAG: hypothetical protein ABIJ08_03680 [Nanoarchaeota archaeon]